MTTREKNAWTRVVRPYVVTRCRTRVVILLPGLVLLAAWMTTCRRPDATIVIDYGVACLFIVALRVMDDLADRAHDCPREPGRVACQPDATRPLAVLAVLASLAAGLLLLANRNSKSVVVVAIAYGIVAAWYAIRDKCRASRLVNSHVVLAKYPLLVVALADRSGFPWELHAGLAILPPAMICYLTLMLFELRDDRDLSADRRAAWCWRLEAVAWLALFVGWMAMRLV